jgi:hypothetical protein
MTEVVRGLAANHQMKGIDKDNELGDLSRIIDGITSQFRKKLHMKGID